MNNTKKQVIFTLSFLAAAMIIVFVVAKFL